MAASNIFQLCFAEQTAKGVPAAAPTHRTRVQSADVSPVPERDRVEETGTGRDGGDRFTSRIHVEGGAEAVLRPKMARELIYAILGAKADSLVGAGPATQRVATPADDQPYYTIWRSLGNTLHERFDDCKFGGLTLSGDAGNPLKVAASIMGLKPTRLNAIPAGGEVEKGTALRVPGVEYQLNSVVNKAITTFSVEISAEQNPIQTTEIYDEFIEPGLRTITVNWTELFRDLDRYTQALYGAAGGTEPSSEIFHMPWRATFGSLVAGPGFRINVPNLAVMTAPLEPDPGGDPLMMECSGEADTPATGNIIELTSVLP